MGSARQPFLGPLGPQSGSQPGSLSGALAGCLAALASELLGAALGWPLEARLALALAVAAAVGGQELLGHALEPGRYGKRGTPALVLGCTGAVLLPSLALTGPYGDWVAQRLPGTDGSLALILTMVVSGPLTEELLHRGLIQRGLSRYWGAGPATLVSTAGFTVVHELAGAGAGPHHVVAGLLLAAVAERSKGWWAPALLHAAGNAGWLMAAS